MTGLYDKDFRESLLDSFSSFGEEGAAIADRVLAALGTDPGVSVRLNPFKKPQSELPILGGASRVPWSPYGYILTQRPVFTLHPLFHAGVYYVQDSSAMFVGHLFREILSRIDRPSVRVLDLCAAPGGKTTDLSASLRERFGDDFLLVSNEVVRSRAAVLSDNVAIWGDPNVVVTSVDPKAFASLEGFFDIIVADVPCSGEGMFRKDAGAVRDWSPQNVELCASRQKRIVSDVWPALRSGGVLLYSTCTFERKENDGNIDFLCENLGAVSLFDDVPSSFEGVLKTPHGFLLLPGFVSGEGQWAGAVSKEGGAVRSREPASALERFRPLRSGLVRGTRKGTDFVPSADWALSIAYERGAYPETEVDKPTALKFLHRDSLVLPDAPLGYNLLTYRGVPLGFVKNLGSRCNNLHPQGRRILMDIQDKI